MRERGGPLKETYDLPGARLSFVLELPAQGPAEQPRVFGACLLRTPVARTTVHSSQFSEQRTIRQRLRPRVQVYIQILKIIEKLLLCLIC